ncbi:DNA helicase RecQ [Clostridia bacterium]|nr:DNA helicase RecQ [Clostridia bacterium]
MSATQILKQYFGYDEFREGQSEIIDALISRRDALGVMPTGAGKSLCYQVPSMLLPGVTLVISPLISLMRDQVQALVVSGVPAAYINSSLTDAQYAKVMSNAANGAYKIIYIAPERLLAPSILELAQALTVSLIAVDEAHCISQWGQDFRPSYLDIPRFVNEIPVRPVVAGFTATATPRVREDILKTLELHSPLLVTTGFDRPNLYFDVKRPKDKYAALKDFLKDRDGNGIVYCSTRKEVEAVTEKLVTDGYSAARYHAGLPDLERSRSQDDFLYEKTRIIVATNAFGMGIDKSDVRFVVHYNMPQNVESYYQEAGRAGRDGIPSDCLLFYARKDISTALFLINRSENEEEKSRNRRLLSQMERYCETDGCLRRYILEYFGERVYEDCGNCGNCKGTFLETDATIDAQKILSCILRINKQNRAFGFGVICKVLQGKNDDYITERKLYELRTFGAMKGISSAYIRRLFDKLTATGYIVLSDDAYRTARLTIEARDVLYNGIAVTIRKDKPKSEKIGKAESSRISKYDSPKYALPEGLFGKLKKLRFEIAKEDGVPAFVVFSDATLVDMCHKHPRTGEEFMQVSGVGQVKLERYGKRFLELLNGEEVAGEIEEPLSELTPVLFLEKMEISTKLLQISRVADNLNAVLLRYGETQTSGMALNKLFIEHGYIEIVDDSKLPTEKGLEVGITTIERNSQRGHYLQCLFGADAQRLIAEIYSERFTNKDSLTSEI